MSDNDGYFGVQQPEQNGDDFNAIAFVVRQILNGRSFCAMVKVMGVDPAGTVDVQPLVNQLDGQGNAIPHGVLNEIPYIRVQGGANAIMIDPQAGDIGLCVFCDRDSSSVKATKDAANPGSLRRSSMADGVYFGGLLNAEPVQFVKFTQDGIEITSPTKIALNAPKIELTAPEIEATAETSIKFTTPTFTVDGDIHATGGATIDGDASVGGDVDSDGTVTGSSDVVGGGKSLKSHFHIAQGPTSPTTTPKP
jgi:hypothetical protein